MTLPRTVADVLADHVSFEVECIDRMYLNVWVPRLAYGGGAAGFFVGHRGHAYASTALMDPMTKTFVADIHHFIAAHDLELVHFGKGERKDEVTARFLAEFTAEEGVLYVGRAQEKSGVWRTQRRHNPATGGSYAWLVRSSAFINFFYFYCVDADFGPFFLKFGTYFPYTAKLCINGNEWAKRQAAKAGLGFDALDNGFAAVDDVHRLQQICDSLGPAHIEALLRKWLRILPNPFTAEDEAAGYRYEMSVLQAEFSLTQMLDRPVSGRIFFEQVLRDNLDLGRPDQIGLVFHRRIITRGRHRTPGRFRTRVITDGVVPSLHVDYKNSKIKAVPQGRESAAHRDHNQRHPRLRDRQTADEPARPAADRLPGQPAPARRPTRQPRPHPRRRRLHRPDRTDRHQQRLPHPRAALRRPPGARAAAGPARPPATTPRVHQP